METNEEFSTKFFYFNPLGYFYISPLTKQRRYIVMKKNNSLVVGNKIEFINRRSYEERRVLRAEIVKVNKKTVKAVSYATSGWNADDEYTVKLEDILAVVEKNKIRKVK